MLSGYQSGMYELFESANSWRSVSLEIDNKSSKADVKEVKTEMLWMNF